MTTRLCYQYYDLSKGHKVLDDLPLIEIFETQQDWNWFRATLVYGAILYAMRQMKNSPVGSEKQTAYETIATAFSETLHRIEDYVTARDEGFGKCRVERVLDWRDSSAHDTFVADLAAWGTSGTAKYRVAAWAKQWEPLGAASYALRDQDALADSRLFDAAFHLEWLAKPGQVSNADKLHLGMLPLCQQAQAMFMTQECLHFFVPPLMALEKFLAVSRNPFQPRFLLQAAQ